VSGPLARAAVVAVAALGALAGLAWWHARGQPVALPDAGVDRLPCVSYAPYRLPGQTPFTKGFVVSPAQIDADLALLVKRTSCIRTYSVDQGLAAVPGLARKHGLRVLLGLWIGRDRAENERELARGLEVLRRDTDAIDAVIVGNEVLLRRELPAAALADYIRRVRAATTLPVTYADVWEFWLQNPEVADAASFVTVHMLPYWEDEPMPIERAVNHVVQTLARVRAAFPGRDVFVGEAGWPSKGRRREGAVPSLVNQARFVRELANAAAPQRMRYNVIEAFDQPWKRRLEGTVGGFWGVLDAAGREKFPLRGALIEDPSWRQGLVAAGLGALLFAFAGVAARSRWRGIVLLALAGAALGAAAAAQREMIVAASRDAFELALGIAFAAISAAATLLAALGLARWLEGRAPLSPAPAAAVAAWFNTNRSRFSATERLLGILRFALLFGAAATALALAFDPRYRDFPLAFAAPPAVALAALAWVAGASADVEERALAAVLAAAAPVIVLREGLANADALAWAALCLALAASVWRVSAHTDTPREHEQAGERPDGAGGGRVQHQPRGAEASGGERPG
jgi:exo-beta-1,3-glucanase (GH17 family)